MQPLILLRADIKWLKLSTESKRNDHSGIALFRVRFETPVVFLIEANYKTTVIESLCRGVSPNASAAALDEMRKKGVKVIATPEEIIEEIRRENTCK